MSGIPSHHQDKSRIREYWDNLSDDNRTTIIGLFVILVFASLLSWFLIVVINGQERREAAFQKARPGWAHIYSFENWEANVRPTEEEIAWAKGGPSGAEIKRLNNPSSLTWGTYLYTDRDGRKRRKAVLAEQAKDADFNGFACFNPSEDLRQGYSNAIVTVEDALVTRTIVAGADWRGSLASSLTLTTPDGPKEFPKGTPVVGQVFVASGELHGALGVKLTEVGGLKVQSEAFVVQKDPVNLAEAAKTARAYVEQGETKAMAKGAVLGGAFGALTARKGKTGSNAATWALLGAALADLEVEAQAASAEEKAKEACPAALLPGQMIRVQVAPKVLNR